MIPTQLDCLKNILHEIVAQMQPQRQIARKKDEVGIVDYLFHLFSAHIDGNDHLHQSPDQLQNQPRDFEEPGLWRPRWIIDREFIDKTTGKVTSRDRLFAKLLSNRTVKLFHSSRRPFLEWRKKEPQQPKKDEIIEDEEGRVMIEEDAIAEDDGSYKFETHEHVFGRLTFDILELLSGERIRYEALCNFARSDPFAMKFEDGEFFRSKRTGSRTGVTVGGWNPAGRFSIRANVNRPLVSKDFLAFQ